MPRLDLALQQIAAIRAMCGDDDDRLLADMIEAETDLHGLVSAVLFHMEEEDGSIAALKNQIEMRQERIKRAETRNANRKLMIAALMTAAKQDKLSLPEATISRRTGDAGLEIVSDDAVPDQYQVTSKRPDKKAINAAFADAEELPNWLQRGEAKEILTVRRR